MNKILILCAIVGMMVNASAYSAARDDASGTATRAPAGTTTRPTTPVRTGTQNDTANTPRATRNVAARAGALRLNNTTHTAGTNVRVRTGDTGATISPRRTVQVGRAATSIAGTPSNEILETRTGAAYARCKTAYFQCMDQFCQLKNDDYRRCSCSSRIYDLANVRQNIVDTNNKLTEFTENLDAVGLTAAQATAIHTASDGENALTADTSASKALLTAIMNSIRGGDTTVSGKMSDLNSINLSFDTVNMFGLNDTAQVIASYNGTELYNAVYPSCRGAVAADCNDASLQRAVTAYLMAIEQDCNTVQTALENKQKDLRAAVRESSAMLDLARVENRAKHNSDNMATCIGNVESAILSEQVCGANYHKCLDNGEFIDVTTGAPITGVVRFYELQEMLKFDQNKDNKDQKLAQNPDNREFVKNFENKTKKFAMDALDKCTEIADTAWAEYLDKALLDIYYAQRAKVQTIKTGCFDLISKCYADRDTAITAAMTELIDGTTELSLMPDKIILTREMCSNYVDSCNNMFADENGDRTIIAEYVNTQADTDTTAACRAVVQQCFDSFGGTNYENFYYPSSGLFEPNIVDSYLTENPDKKLSALDWFSLYEYDADGTRKPGYKSKCAKLVADITSCADKVEQVFGGLDAIVAGRDMDEYGQYTYSNSGNPAYGYGWAKLNDGDTLIPWNNPDDYYGNGNHYKFKNRRLRPTGVATEVYNQIIDSLTTQCMNLQGKFIEAQFIDHNRYGASDDSNGNICKLKTEQCTTQNNSNNLNCAYGLLYYNIEGGNMLHHENMCPQGYTSNTDANAWGICSCWENGGRRSKHGLISKCTATLPVKLNTPIEPDSLCDNTEYSTTPTLDTSETSMYNTFNGLLTINPTGFINHWCNQTKNTTTTTPIQPGISSGNQVCPVSGCTNIPSGLPAGVPDGITNP